MHKYLQSMQLSEPHHLFHIKTFPLFLTFIAQLHIQPMHGSVIDGHTCNHLRINAKFSKLETT